MNLKLFIVIVLCILHQSVNAQRLPTKQKSALHAPKSVSIDGNLSEWQNKFQAYNRSTQLYYTLSNDETNLYLVVQSGDPLIAQKMLYGITFSVSSNSKRLSTTAPSFTFPLVDWKVRSPIVSAIGKQEKKRTTNTEMVSDSLINEINKQLNEVAKVKTTSLASIADTLAFLKSSEIVKAMGKFDNEFRFTYELAVPIKELGLKGSTFIYNVKLNGSNSNATLSADGKAIVSAGGSGTSVVLTASPSDLIVKFPTDFTADYTLIEK